MKYSLISRETEEHLPMQASIALYPTSPKFNLGSATSIFAIVLDVLQNFQPIIKKRLRATGVSKLSLLLFNVSIFSKALRWEKNRFGANES